MQRIIKYFNIPKKSLQQFVCRTNKWVIKCLGEINSLQIVLIKQDFFMHFIFCGGKIN